MSLNVNNGELDRIIDTISKDLDNWDGQTDIIEFIAEILKKRAFLSDEEAKKDADKIIKGIVKYKKAKELIEDNPEIGESIWNKVDDQKKHKLIEVIKDTFEMAKELVKDILKNNT